LFKGCDLSQSLQAQVAEFRQTFLRHSAMDDARCTYIKTLIRMFGNDIGLNRLYMELGKTLISGILLVLHARQDLEEPATYVTLTELESIVVGNGFASRGRLRSYMSRMEDLGLITFRPHPADRRKKWIIVSDKLIRNDIDSWVNHVSVLAMLDSHPLYEKILAGDIGTISKIRSVSLETLPLAVSLFGDNVELGGLMGFDSGLMVFILILDEARKSSGDGPVIVPYTRIAQTFGVSRTHVWKVVSFLESAGLVTVDSKGSAALRILPRAHILLGHWVAHICAILRVQCDLVSRQMQLFTTHT
jgi:hypothetical protein